jgi:hypothetical protein
MLQNLEFELWKYLKMPSSLDWIPKILRIQEFFGTHLGHFRWASGMSCLLEDKPLNLLVPEEDILDISVSSPTIGSQT